ncbi:MAG: ATP-dependent Clp protease proteolytic subunit [Verrucomicrobia bacterium]|nr:ATP-dependent Clp protease proteolytic subunit [Verrucomicrobiota bacterium]
MKAWLALLLTLIPLMGAETNSPVAAPASDKKVYVLPVREDIMPPLVYLVRRGVKQAMEDKADLLVIDMETNGGRVDTCREIISILSQFKGDSVTFVNKDAFSAGAFIAVATKRIYMAPQSVIGAAAPIMLSPTGEGAVNLPSTYEEKMNSAVRALVRAVAEKNGYDVAVVEAMIDKDKGLVLSNVVDGVTNVVTIAKVGKILTLTNTEAEKEYGQPPRRLLSSGTAENVDDLLKKLGYGGATRVDVKPTGAEKLGTWINAISPILLIIGVVGLYIEFKTPGFGFPGIVGIVAFALYFLGSYVAGFSGMEWILLFFVGLVLVLLEIFFFPGTMALGITGAALMLVAIVMALVDVYPKPADVPGPVWAPSLPALTAADFNHALFVLSTAMAGAGLCICALRYIMPRTTVYHAMVSESASGVASVAQLEQRRAVFTGAVGVAISNLRPGGKAQFGDDILDVITQGDLLVKGQKVRIIGYSGTEAIVEAVGENRTPSVP